MTYRDKCIELTVKKIPLVDGLFSYMIIGISDPLTWDIYVPWEGHDISIEDLPTLYKRVDISKTGWLPEILAKYEVELERMFLIHITSGNMVMAKGY